MEKLSGIENWGLWKFEIRVLISASGSMDVVRGTLLKPERGNAGDAEATATYEKKLEKWNKLDSSAQKIIVQTVSRQCMLHIINCQTAKEMWDKLHSIYENKSETSKHCLQQKWYSLKKETADDISIHIAKINDLACRLNIAGEPVTESSTMTKILMTLPPAYQSFIEAWESTSEAERTLVNLTARLTTKELRMNATENNSDSAFPMKANQRRGAKGKKLGPCYNCGKPGHLKRDCKKKEKTANQSETNPGQQAKGSALVAAIISAQGLCSTKVSTGWFLDSGASQHMSPTRSWFVNYTALAVPIKVRVGNGEIILAKGRGDINILSYDGAKWQEHHLSPVLHVPDLHYNLMSMSSALDKGLKFGSDKQQCWLKSGEDIVAVGDRYEDLYKMRFRICNEETPENRQEQRANVVESDSLRVWHERLAHQNVTQVRRVLKGWNIHTKAEEHWDCDGCAKGKMSRKPFPSSQTKAKAPGELMHADLCGPMESPSVGNSRYFLLFKDDFSHYKFVFFLNQKSEVKTVFEELLKRLDTQLNRKIKVLRTDNGLEFVNKDMRTIMQRHGIKHETSAAYTPEQNGAVERENRTLVEAARSMIYSKQLDIKLWAEAVNTATYVLNRTGPSGTKDKTPHELWFGEKAEKKEYRIFGTEVWTHVPKQKRQKWSAKARKGIFVGYDENTKGYRVWFPSQGKIDTHRDVKFIAEEKLEIKKQEKEYATIRTTNGTSEGEEESDDEGQSTDNDQSEENSTDGYMTDEGAREAPDQQHTAAEPQDETGQRGDNGDAPGTSGEKRQLRSREKLRPPQRYTDYELDYGDVFVVETEEPQDYHEAMKSTNKAEWKKAMEDEMGSLHENSTWDLVYPPQNAKVLPNRWVFRRKPAIGGRQERFKARLVVKGFSQRPGIDYEETFSPVVKFGSIRTVLAVAAMSKMQLMQFDVKTAYLNGDLDEEIYMQQPKGYEDGSGKICKLRKALYGLKQSARCWNRKFVDSLKKFKLTATSEDPCVFVSHNENEILILAIYIDDGLIASTSSSKITSLLQHLSTALRIIASPLSTFLGMEIEQYEDGSIFANQAAYARKVLDRFRMDDANSVAIPADQHTSLSLEDPSLEDEVVHVPYKEAVGSLLFLATVTRPDIAYSVSAVSQYAEAPRKLHWNAVKRILKYVKGTVTHGIWFPGEHEKIRINAYSDADFAGDKRTRKSTSGFIVKVADATVVWGSQKQKSVALSTMESEYIAASQTSKELIWSDRLLKTLVTSKVEVPIIHIDNQSAINFIKNPQISRNSKHIEVRYHFVKDHYERKDFEIEYVNTNEQIADIMTKPLSKQRFEYLRSKINVISKKEAADMSTQSGSVGNIV